MTKSEKGIVIIDPGCELSDDVYDELNSQIDWDTIEANGKPVKMMSCHTRNGDDFGTSNKTEDSHEEGESVGIILTGRAFVKIFGEE